MKAAVLGDSPGELLVDEVEIDRPAENEVLVQVAATGLCHSDLHFVDGVFTCPVPTILGHEAAGVVEAVGSQVSSVSPGDHVVTCLSIYCGRCQYCLDGRPHLCARRDLTGRSQSEKARLTYKGAAMPQFVGLSTFAEYALVHANALAKVDREMPMDRAALLGCAVVTGVGSVINTAKVTPGSSVAVIGAGGVGLNAIQGAILAGAVRVIAIDLSDKKLELASLFGATNTVNATSSDPVEAVKELADGGVDFSFEFVGRKETAEQAYYMLGKGGTATIAGMIPPGIKLELEAVDLRSEKKIQGSSMGSNKFKVDIPKFAEMYQRGRLRLDELVSRRLTLDAIADGFDELRTGEAARSVVVFD